MNSRQRHGLIVDRSTAEQMLADLNSVVPGAERFEIVQED